MAKHSRARYIRINNIGPVYELELPMPTTPNVTLTDSQGVTLGPVSGLDAKGNPASLAGPATWASSDPTILSVAPSADGLSCDVEAVGALGNCQVTVNDGAATAVVNFTVVGGAAVSLNVPVGTPVEQQPAPAPAPAPAPVPAPAPAP